jgi:hypothetical protein
VWGDRKGRGWNVKGLQGMEGVVFERRRCKRPMVEDIAEVEAIKIRVWVRGGRWL